MYIIAVTVLFVFMDLLIGLISFILHIDRHLNAVILQYGSLTYIFISFIIFMETGFVITPFLPGDSLIFAAGAFAALGSLNVAFLFILLSLSAILGDTVNYWIGHFIGPKAFSGSVRFLKKEYLDKTHAYFEKYGGKTIILARFVPIVRTFAPFVAGIGAMTYGHFILYNVIGGLLWVSLFLFGGYFFGNLPIVKHNFTYVILVIIVISVLPAVAEYLKSKSKNRTGNQTHGEKPVVPVDAKKINFK
jgi:membrane-associated protein